MAKILEPSTTMRHSSTVKRLAVGGVALSAAALATLALYGHHADTFHHDTARLLAEITSAKGIEVTLRARADVAGGLLVHGILLPRAATSGAALDFDGRISYELAGAQYNFTLLDQHAYVTVADLATGLLSRSECLHPDNVPPIATLSDALQNARVVDAVEGFNVTCASGKMVEFDFAGEPYVLCSNGASNGGPGTVLVTGDDVEASLTLLRANSEGVPSLASLAPPAGLDLSTCAAITTATGDASLVDASTVASSRLLQRTRDVFQVATGRRRLGKMGSDDCSSCKGGKKQCLFVHGFGYPDTGAATDSFEYFGTIEQQLPCCASVQFIHLDTNDEAWYSDTLTTKLCATAVTLTNSANPMELENIAIIAHSMGNLITAAAIMNSKCGIGASSTWISLAGSIYGTMIATTFVTAMEALPPATRTSICSKDPNAPKLDDVVYSLVDGNGLCSTLTSLKSIAAKGSKKSTPELDALLLAAGEVYKANVGANICGVSPVGLVSSDSIKLVAEALIAGHPSAANDAQVHIDSCRGPLPLAQYQTSWNGGAFYKASLNHLDIAMRHGDGWWGSDRKPIKWLNCQL